VHWKASTYGVSFMQFFILGSTFAAVASTLSTRARPVDSKTPIIGWTFAGNGHVQGPLAVTGGCIDTIDGWGSLGSSYDAQYRDKYRCRFYRDDNCQDLIGGIEGLLGSPPLSDLMEGQLGTEKDLLTLKIENVKKKGAKSATYWLA
jgi:hypothetical protein